MAGDKVEWGEKPTPLAVNTDKHEDWDKWGKHYDLRNDIRLTISRKKESDKVIYSTYGEYQTPKAKGDGKNIVLDSASFDGHPTDGIGVPDIVIEGQYTAYFPLKMNVTIANPPMEFLNNIMFHDITVEVRTHFMRDYEVIFVGSALVPMVVRPLDENGLGISVSFTLNTVDRGARKITQSKIVKKGTSLKDALAGMAKLLEVPIKLDIFDLFESSLRTDVVLKKGTIWNEAIKKLTNGSITIDGDKKSEPEVIYVNYNSIIITSKNKSWTKKAKDKMPRKPIYCTGEKNMVSTRYASMSWASQFTLTLNDFYPHLFNTMLYTLIGATSGEGLTLYSMPVNSPFTNPRDTKGSDIEAFSINRGFRFGTHTGGDMQITLMVEGE